MGLDQYAYIEGNKTHQWRKYFELDDYMVQIASQQHPFDPDWNCVPITLSADHLDKLEQYMQQHQPREVVLQEQDEWHREWEKREVEYFQRQYEDVFDFIKQARAALAEGKKVEYDRWY